MRAAWYERAGAAPDVLVVGEMPLPEAGPGEVRIRLATSGINAGDLKKRQDTFGLGLAFARIVPHSDGAGRIDSVGERVDPAQIGRRVWCYGAQSYRPFGTAAEYVVVPAGQAVPLADDVTFAQGACLGIPGITAYQAVHAAGSVRDRTVLVQGGAGTVGLSAVALAQFAGASVVATVRSEADESTAKRAGAHAVIRTDGLLKSESVDVILDHAPNGIDHVVDVAFDKNIEVDSEVLVQGGSIATYATGDATPAVPFWPLVFKNIRVFFLGSDDFSNDTKLAAANALNKALEAGWNGYEIGAKFALSDIARAHECLENRAVRGRVVVEIQEAAAQTT